LKAREDWETLTSFPKKDLLELIINGTPKSSPYHKVAQQLLLFRNV